MATSQPSSDTASAAEPYFQQATFDTSQLTESQQYAYRPYAAQQGGSGLAGEAMYQAQSGLSAANTVATAVGRGSGVIPADREQC